MLVCVSLLHKIQIEYIMVCDLENVEIFKGYEYFYTGVYWSICLSSVEH